MREIWRRMKPVHKLASVLAFTSWSIAWITMLAINIPRGQYAEASFGTAAMLAGPAIFMAIALAE